MTYRSDIQLYNELQNFKKYYSVENYYNNLDISLKPKYQYNDVDFHYSIEEAPFVGRVPRTLLSGAVITANREAFIKKNRFNSEVPFFNIIRRIFMNYTKSVILF